MMLEPTIKRHRVRSFLMDEDGPSATEYAILLALIILVSVVAIQSVGESFSGIYYAIADQIPEA